jgi:hypothetical protein
MSNKTHADFVALLDKCREQVTALPEAYTDNPHLYEILHRVYLRLCSGNIEENAAGKPGFVERLADPVIRRET